MVQVPPPVHGASLRNQSLFQSELLQGAFELRLLPLAFADSIRSIGRPSGKKIIKTFNYAIRLITTLVRFRPPVAYFTLTPAGGAFYRDCLFVLILKLFGVRRIYHLRGIGITRAMSKGGFNRWLYLFVFRNSYVVCLSRKHLEDISGLNYKKHFVVPNGIKTEIKPEWVQTQKREKISFLFLSNFVRSKGVIDFIDALAELAGKAVKFDACIAGADYDLTRSEIENYVAEKQLTASVRVFGPVFGEEKFRLIGSSDIFVFPTYYPFELFPGVILEAMQCSKPVISTYHGVIEDIIDNESTGLLVPTRRVTELAESMYDLAINPDRAYEMGRKGKEKFEEEFTLTKFEQNVKAVFEEVLDA